MRPALRSKLLWTTGLILGSGAVILAILGFVLVKDGAYPPEGTGSLGHVGMVIAGLIAGFISIALALLAAFFIAKAKPKT